jgi:hypothetical protein
MNISVCRATATVGKGFTRAGVTNTHCAVGKFQIGVLFWQAQALNGISGYTSPHVETGKPQSAAWR